MRRLISLALLSLSLTSAQAFADCSSRLIYGGAYRNSAVDVAIDGNDLWVATQYGVELFDRSVTPPRAITTLALPGPTVSVRALLGVAYVGSGSTLYAVKFDGRALNVVGSAAVNGTIRDILLYAPYMFVAATNGVTELDIFNPEHPAVDTRLSTTSGGAYSLARLDTTLYAADGDNSVEAYSVQTPSLPQKIGTFTALPQTISVRVAANRIFASDGQQTQLFAGSGASPSRLASLPFGATSVFALNGTTVWAAGNSRTIRVVDVADPSLPVTLYQTAVPVGGSLNRVSAMTGASGVVYAAAGDAGVVTFDATTFAAPFPLHAFSTGDAVTVAASNTVVAVTPSTGGILVYARNGATVIATPATYGAGKVWTLRDAVDNLVLASSGAELSVFDLSKAPGAPLSSGTFAKPIRSAALVGTTVLAVLSDLTLWRGDITTPTFTPALVDTAGATPSFVAHSGNAVVLADLNADGTTTLRYWSDGRNMSTPPVVRQVEGAATSGVALNGSTAAVATFKGVFVVDFNGSTTTISGVPPAVGLTFDSAGNVVVLTGNHLQIYSPSTQALVRSIELPDFGTAIGVGTSTDRFVAIGSGFASYTAGASGLPTASVTPPSNRYYKSLGGDGDQLILIDGATVDRFLLNKSGAPVYSGTVSLDPATFDVAIVGTRLYALTNDLRVVQYSMNGTELSVVQLSEGADATALGIRNVAGAVHVSILKGCLAGACEKKTLVFDPRGMLQQTAQYNGALVDFTINGTTAWLLTDLPAELRRVDVADPYHPVVAAAVATTGNPTSLAFANNALLVVGDNITSYSPTTLAKGTSFVDPYTSDPTGRVSYLDQAIRVSGDCATVVGRTFAPQRFTVTSPTSIGAITALPFAAAGKRILTLNGDTYILTDYSLEVYSSKAAPKRKRGVR